MKTPGHFAAAAVKLREFFNENTFGATVDLDAPGYLQTMARKDVAQQTIDCSCRRAANRSCSSENRHASRRRRGALYTTPPFPWSRPVYEAEHSVFNLQACDNEYEGTFAK